MKSLGQKKFKDKSPEEVNKILSDAWLNIVVDENKIFNPITNIPDYLSDKPHIYYTWLMSQPSYFSFLCSEILNVNILPFQSVILNEMWNRKFPMLIGSRGLSKAIKPTEPVLTEHGWKPIIDIQPGDKVYSRDGKLCNVKATTGLMNDLSFYKISFEDGRNIECCEDHTWLVIDDISQPLSYNIATKDLEVQRKFGKGKDFFIPVSKPIETGTLSPSDFEIHPYLMGLIVRSGYKIGGETQVFIYSNKVFKKLYDLGIHLKVINESESRYLVDIPYSSIDIYENGNLESRMHFMDGIFSQMICRRPDTYDMYHNTEITDVVANISRSCGYYTYYVRHNLNSYVTINTYRKFCKITDIQKIGKRDGCCIEVDSNDHTYITKDYIVTHNSFLMGLYSLIRAFLMPKRKIVICGAAFRQSKVVYEYAANIWHNSPLLRDIIGTSGNNGPRNMTDMCRLTLKDSMISALPIGCLSKDTLITTSDGIREMGEYSDQNFPSKIWSESSFKDVGFFFDNGLGDCKNIKTNLGYEYTGTPNHKMKIVRDNKIIFCRTDEMLIGDEILIDTSERWFNPSFEATDEMGYALGCMIGDGSYVRKERLQFTTIDPEFIPRLKCIGDFKIQKDGLHYFLCKSGKVKEWMDFWGLDYTYTADKKLPNSLLSSSKSVVANCIAGIFDTDGHIFTSSAKGGMSISINFTTISEKLAKQIQYILLHFGIRSSLRNRERDQILRGKRSNSSRVYELMISGQEVVKFYQRIPIKLNRKKIKLENALSLKTKFNSIKNDYVPVNKDLLIEIVNEFNVGHRFHIKDIEHKKTITKNYLIKFINKCQELNINHNNLSILKDFINPNIFFDKITSIKDMDSVYTVDLNVPSNNTYIANGFISHNTGDKIRGQRASDILSDEFSSIPRDIFETVIAGFAAVSADPANNVRESAKKKMQELMGLEMDEEQDIFYSKTNQIAISGTAYYDFNHFSTYWKKWHDIIMSKGDPKKLKQVFAGEVPEHFNWKDYSIMRIPYNLLPYGFMDQGQLARSKATVHSGIFLMEFSACQTFDTPIITDKGIKKIVDVNIGDLVLTHKGRFRSVIKKTCRPYKGDIINFKTYGYYEDFKYTPEHPFWINGDDFEEIGNISKYTNLAPIKELYNLQEIDLTEICTNYIENEDFIYPQSSQTKLSNKDRKNIIERLKQGEKHKDLAKEFNVGLTTIYQTTYNNFKPKNKIPKIIKVDYDLGVIFGYYASEGSVGSEGKACSFALDGHKDKKLEYFVSELSLSLKRSIGLQTRLYEENSITHVNINSRIFCEFIKHFCPGICYDKMINHELLFSNEEFMRGFITGIWNGDGHINKNFASIHLTNKNLINQIRLVLSYFGINSSFLKPKKEKTGFIKNKQVNLSDVWRLNISGRDFDKFLKIFYNSSFEKDIKRVSSVFFKEDKCKFKIKNKEYIKYDGMVYNLEVEEDHSYSTPIATVHNCFSKDSNGFYKRSLIESCTITTDKSIMINDKEIIFDAVIKGDPKAKYVYAVDPASESDNLSIVILEICPGHRRTVYCWTTNRKEHIERVKNKLISETDFYSYCAKKIRELMKTFTPERIAIDSQGGGVAIIEALHDKDKIGENELPIWEIIETGVSKPSDMEQGLHIIEKVNFASVDFTSGSNHGLRKDMEDKVILFPFFNAAALSVSLEDDNIHGRMYDTLEDCMMEIEELKNELTTIVVTQTPGGREHWDTPDAKIPGMKKGKLRKDRYSALLMANYSARNLDKSPKPINYETTGGFAQSNTKEKEPGVSFIGTPWLASAMNGLYD